MNLTSTAAGIELLAPMQRIWADVSILDNGGLSSVNDAIDPGLSTSIIQTFS